MENDFQGQDALYENQKNSGESKKIYDNCKEKVSNGSQKAFSQTEETKVINKKLSSKKVEFIITSEEKAKKKRSPKKPKILFKVIKIEEKTQVNFIKSENKRKRSKTPNKPKSRLVLFKVEKKKEIKKEKRKKLKDKNDISNTSLTTEAPPSEPSDNTNLLNIGSEIFDLLQDDILREEVLDILAGISSNHQRDETRPEIPGLNLEPETKPFTIILKKIK